MKFKFFYKSTDGSTSETVIVASNHGIAKNRFKQTVKDCLKILKIEKEK